MRRILFLALAGVVGCATQSPVLTPQVTPPAAYGEAATPGAAELTGEWWKTFNSAELQALAETALAGSPDLAVATERVRQAEAQVQVAGASLFPSLDLGFSTRKARDSESSSTALSASYEVDLFGRNAAGVRGAQASLRASGFDREAARLTLLAGVA